MCDQFHTQLWPIPQKCLSVANSTKKFLSVTNSTLVIMSISTPVIVTYSTKTIVTYSIFPSGLMQFMQRPYGILSEFSMDRGQRYNQVCKIRTNCVYNSEKCTISAAWYAQYARIVSKKPELNIKQKDVAKVPRVWLDPERIHLIEVVCKSPLFSHVTRAKFNHQKSWPRKRRTLLQLLMLKELFAID